MGLKTSEGRMTLPVEKGLETEMKSLFEKWGVDAVRNSDGTELPEELKDFGLMVYSTLCMVRADQKFAKANMDKLQQKYLCSHFCTATADNLEIDILKEYYKEQFSVDTHHDPKKWWQVVDRTDGSVVDPANWKYDSASGTVKISGTKKFHQYSVSFLVYQVWDSTSMYNALTNDWEGEHSKSVDPYQPEVWDHLLSYLDQWLEKNPNTDVVRFTSVAYHFTNVYGKDATPKYRDWSGYSDCISPRALEDFAREKGYALTPEDFINGGLFTDVNNVPTKAYLDWIDFINAFVTRLCKAWVDKVHAAGRETMMFFCDHWIGTEPYGPRFKEIGFDAIVNACKNGLEARRIGDVPVDIIKEARLYPYFFPVNLKEEPSFAPGGDPAQECRDYWMMVRRAMARNLLDRIGFGGYLSLAVQFPDFLDEVTNLKNEFAEMHAQSKQTAPWKPGIKVAVLNAWGSLRSWITKEYDVGGLMEALTGLNVDVQFINFTDIEQNGIPEDVDVIINTGNEGTAWSGGENWLNEKVVTTIREWVANGGGFIGVGEPTACRNQGRIFQLSDILGVDQERGFSRGKVKPSKVTVKGHFILEDQPAALKLGKCADGIFACEESTEVLLQEKGNIQIAVNAFGKGRAVYLSGYVFSWENIRLAHRTIFWAAGNEDRLQQWFSSNLYTECSAYPETGKCMVFNNSEAEQKTTVYNETGKSKDVVLAPRAVQWFDLTEF